MIAESDDFNQQRRVFLPGSNRVFSSNGVVIAESNEFFQQRRFFFYLGRTGFFLFFIFGSG